MGVYYSGATLRKMANKKWCGILTHEAPNPDYIEDTRSPKQRRKSFGKRANPDYIEDTRTSRQKRKTISKQVTKVFDTTVKNEAYNELAIWRAKMESEQSIADDAKLTVDGYVSSYIDKREQLGTAQASTIKFYRRTAKMLKRGGRRAIAGIQIRDLKPSQVESWEAALMSEGLSGTTCLHAHRMLKLVCKYAEEIGDIDKTPVRGFKAPSKSTANPNALDAAGRRTTMLKLLEEGETRTAVLGMLALYTGMRRAEMAALTWGNVDLEGIRWQNVNEQGPKLRVVQAFGESLDGTYLKPPKTARGYRVIPLTGGIVGVLASRRKKMWQEWSEAMQELEIVPNEDEFNKIYVLGEVNGEACTPNALTMIWRAFARGNNITGTEGKTVSLHDLRHSFATSAITRGVDVSSVSANLGHGQISTTLDMYASVDTAAQRAANDAVAADLDAARTGEVLPFKRTGTD